MHPNFCVHEHFDLITNPFKYKCETFQIFMVSVKIQFMSNGFNNIPSEWFNLCANVISSKDAKHFIKPFKYIKIYVFIFSFLVF
jgi:hypothetical protein